MQLITKSEAFEMRKQGLEKYVKSSKSRHPKYYIVEAQYALGCLNRYRENKTVGRYN